MALPPARQHAHRSVFDSEAAGTVHSVTPIPSSSDHSHTTIIETLQNNILTCKLRFSAVFRAFSKSFKKEKLCVRVKSDVQA
jgi:hypothetical protein